MRHSLIGGDWKAHKLTKQGKSSRTPGKLKGDTCKTNARKKYFLCSPKAVKHKDYGVWHLKAKEMNK